MPNSPAPETVTVSFTLPRGLADAVTRRARMDLTNKSDIIRRALLAYIPKDEADAVMRELMGEAAGGAQPSKARKKGGGKQRE